MNSAGILFTDGNHILLLKRANGSHPNTWGLPGGHAKSHESEIETANRETKEETGINKIPGNLLGKHKGDNGSKVFTTFVYKIKDKFTCEISEEHSDWKWFAIKDLKSQNLHPGLEKSLPDYFKIIKNDSKSFKEWVTLANLDEIA